jgi:DNA invertase Pin-like site-specific DNA recombinase
MSKISADHLRREAYVYVRQSTPGQVKNHLESQRLQYALAERATQLGWRSCTIIDDDQGRSASGIHRVGFDSLLGALCEGKVGAVLCIEASRLARNGRDWHTLLEFCSLVDTLIIDAAGVYDPKQSDDRALLGLKGTFSEMELSAFRSRAQAAIKHKAGRGQLLRKVATGYVRGADDRIDKDPDQRIREAIDLVFHKFHELGSVRQVTLWMRREHIELPISDYAAGPREVVWKQATYDMLHRILTNPIFAGAYAYGRTKTKVRIENGRKRLLQGNRVEQRDWQVLLLDHHEGYISWEQYQANRLLIAQNANMKGAMVRGSPKCGEALLAGLLRCGRCGCKLYVAYTTHHGHRYECHDSKGTAGIRCVSFGGWHADQLVSHEVLQRLTPFGIQASLEAAEQIASAGDERVRQKELALERARYEMQRAQCNYEAVDPLNRLVAAELERRWNDAMEAHAQAQEDIKILRDSSGRKLSANAQEELLRLGTDLPRLWSHPAASPEIKKRILRIVLTEIVVTRDDSKIRLVLHWQGGDHSELRYEKRGKGQHRFITDSKTIEIMENLARVLPDEAIAALLNRLGIRTAHGDTWTARRVCSQRNDRGIAAYREEDRHARGELLVSEMANVLNVGYAAALRLVRKGLIPATRACTGAPWVIRKEHLETYQAAQPTQSPQTANSNQLSIDLQ